MKSNTQSKHEGGQRGTKTNDEGGQTTSNNEWGLNKGEHEVMGTAGGNGRATQSQQRASMNAVQRVAIGEALFVEVPALTLLHNS